MSKLVCRCGHIIVDQTDDLPYKAALLREQHEEVFFSDASLLADELLAAASAGSVDELLERHYGRGGLAAQAHGVLRGQVHQSLPGLYFDGV